jgi:hypothetical protein
MVATLVARTTLLKRRYIMSNQIQADPVAEIVTEFSNLSQANQTTAALNIIGQLDDGQLGEIARHSKLAARSSSSSAATPGQPGQATPKPATQPGIAPEIKSPDRPTIDFLWKCLIIGALIIAAVGALTLAIAAFVPSQSNNITYVITVFTSAMGFLGGSFIPSPLQSGSQNATNSSHTS